MTVDFSSSTVSIRPSPHGASSTDHEQSPCAKPDPRTCGPTRAQQSCLGDRYECFASFVLQLAPCSTNDRDTWQKSQCGDDNQLVVGSIARTAFTLWKSSASKTRRRSGGSIVATSIRICLHGHAECSRNRGYVRVRVKREEGREGGREGGR
eukprot:SAG11_NODE_7661_length_1113_cov_2.571006_1_plen_151_part_10